MSKFNILLVGPHPPETGGPSSHVHDLARALTDRGHKVIVLCREDHSHKGYLLSKKQRYEVIMVKGWNPQSMLRLPKILHFLQTADIVHTHTYQTAYVMNILRKVVRRKLVTTLHSYYVREKLGLGKGPIKIIACKIIEANVIKKSDALIAVDHRIAKWVDTNYERKVELVLKNNLYLRDFERYKNINKGDLLIVCPRHLHPKNGVHMAIEAIKILVKERGYKNISLMIIGEGSQKKFLETLVKDWDLQRYVTFLGNMNRNETICWIARSQVTLIPSIPLEGLEEATSIAALESMAVGTPVVASKIGGLAEIVKDKQTGILVEPNLSQNLAEAIDSLINNATLYDFIAKQAYEYVRTEHDWSKNVELVEEVYGQIL